MRSLLVLLALLPLAASLQQWNFIGRTPCTTNYDCTIHEWCINGWCEPHYMPRKCKANPECGVGAVCQKGTCKRVPKG